MKAGRLHQIPLSARALEILRDGYMTRGASALICPGKKPDEPLSNMTFLKAARRLTTTPITVHGFRSSFRDWSAEQTNVPRDVCEAALAHTVRDKTEAAYKRTDLFDRRRDLMAAWSQLATKTSGKESSR
jgi:integrase